MANATCSHDDCERSTVARGLCRRHYNQWHRALRATTDEPLVPPAAERLAAKVDQRGPDECWPWTGPLNVHGYGNSIRTDDGRRIGPHVLAYELAKGRVPDGLEVDHICHNPPCCNPRHLRSITHRANVLRSRSPMAENARKTHCDRGHPLEGDNLYNASRGGRVCRLCRLDDYRKKVGRPVGDSVSEANRKKTHCVNGHEFTEENTRVRPDGARACRTCAREFSRKYAAAKKEQA